MKRSNRIASAVLTLGAAATVAALVPATAVAADGDAPTRFTTVESNTHGGLAPELEGSGIAAGDDVESFVRELERISGLQAGTPSADKYEDVGQVLRVELFDKSGELAADVSRVNAGQDVPASLLNSNEAPKIERLSTGSELATSQDADGASAATLSTSGQLTYFASVAEDVKSLKDLASWARQMDDRQGDKVNVTMQDPAAEYGVLAKPSCSVSKNKPWKHGGAIKAQVGISCNQRGTARVGSYVEQYRGAGIWRQKASKAEERKNVSALSVTSSWTCAKGTGNQLYRSAIGTRQLKNSNGSWFGSNRSYGPQYRVTCG
ncbi:hypothetical protein H9Y04_35495 [Streptomyces sp. TRM66268-LWL]|uniref:Secreted protein n=1 Tax=Streptomyces polyasparticus TaxID=2767826 RepID=A0ABR7ST65_9ACTN|nr:hypothetical protein [Streptomyces polyasparticus]MBC9717850.1 hypothetical protein [Streptomyces polyasparticus]